MGLAPQRHVPPYAVTMVPDFADGAVAELRHGADGTVIADIRIPGPDVQHGGGTECCGALMVTTTHQAPSWYTCADCGQPVTITGRVIQP